MIIENCLQCNDEFEIYPCKLGIRKFCSHKCYSIFERNRIPKICPICGEMFLPIKVGGIYCSISCSSTHNWIINHNKYIGKNASNWRGGNVTKECLFCGNTFGAKRYRIDRSKYCSKECQYKHQKFLYLGKNNPCWRGGHTPERQAFYNTSEWREVSQQIWKRDNATCQRCDGNWRDIETFHIHHIISFAIKEYRAKLGNLILLCKPCHKWVHSKKNVNKEFIKEI